MAKAIQIAKNGGPEVLEYVDVDVPAPGEGQVLLDQKAVGLNFIDINHRRGTYLLKDFPVVIGMEAAGVVAEVGPGVTSLAAGDRVTYCMVLGAYADQRVIAADRVVKLPDAISDEQAAAVTLQGLTAQYLLRSSYPVKAGDTILVHAAAGGVGLLLCQWAKHLGATVIGTVGSDDKASYAAAHGCDHPIVYTRDDFVARVMEITDGVGVAAVYDAIGQDTFMKGLDALADFGSMVTYGEASGPVPPIDPRTLGAKALSITRGSLAPFTRTRERLEPRTADLFEVIGSGAVKIEINQRYPLSDTAQAQRDMEGRRTTGSTVLIP